MSKIQIGQSTLGALKSGNKIGNPWHNPRNGEFASGPGGASASSSPTTATQKDSPREKSDVMNFVVEHRKDAAIIAASLDVPTEMILGLSGAETLWGKGRFAVQGNNFFHYMLEGVYHIKRVPSHMAKTKTWHRSDLFLILAVLLQPYMAMQYEVSQIRPLLPKLSCAQDLILATQIEGEITTSLHSQQLR
jgi:hypothetical protein